MRDLGRERARASRNNLAIAARDSELDRDKLFELGHISILEK